MQNLRKGSHSVHQLHVHIVGYGAWSTGNITDEIIQEYLNHHSEGPNNNQNFILE